MPHLNGEDDGVCYGVWGESDATGSGVVGVTRGPFAAGEQAAAVPFPPTVRVGVYGYNQTADVATAVLGQNGGGGLINPAPAGSGHTPSGSTVGAVWGDSLNGNGVYGSSANWNGVEGDSWSAAHAGIAGQNNVGGAAVWGWSTGNAGEFHGNHLVTGNAVVQGNQTVQGTLTAIIDVILGADCAEEFDVTDAQRLEPGTVVVIDEEGALRESRDAYDKKVAGIVSGAGGYRPGIILDRKASDASRTVVALIGKVYCKVDAGYAPIEMGDLLTPSPTPGHAMKATDSLRAFGAVIGKALRPLRSGTALIPVLVALQ